jgi:hypothetical protein
MLMRRPYGYTRQGLYLGQRVQVAGNTGTVVAFGGSHGIAVSFDDPIGNEFEFDVSNSVVADDYLNTEVQGFSWIKDTDTIRITQRPELDYLLLKVIPVQHKFVAWVVQADNQYPCFVPIEYFTPKVYELHELELLQAEVNKINLEYRHEEQYGVKRAKVGEKYWYVNELYEVEFDIEQPQNTELLREDRHSKRFSAKNYYNSAERALQVANRLKELVADCCMER